MFESLLPVWVNLLFVIFAQTIIWVFFISGLFANSANKVISAINRCVRMGKYTAPFSSEKISDSKFTTDVISKSIKPVPGPTIQGNEPSIQKLLICIVVSALLLLAMTALAHPDARRNVLWYFVLASVAYLFEVFFLAWVVVPYNHIGDVEVMYEASNVDKMNHLSMVSVRPNEEISRVIAPLLEKL